MAAERICKALRRYGIEFWVGVGPSHQIRRCQLFIQVPRHMSGARHQGFLAEVREAFLGEQCPYKSVLEERRVAPVMSAPHPPLPTYYDKERDRGSWVRGLFDRTAADYDRLEFILGLGFGFRYRRRALRGAGLRPGMLVLDIGTGTGLLARAAAHIVGDPTHVTGVDPSSGMLEHARVPPGLQLRMGSAESIPAAASSADFLCMGYALRHVSELSVAFSEFFRVLRPGGRLCVLEMTAPGGGAPRAILKAWMHGVMPRVASVVTRRREAATLMRYHWDTIAACVPPALIVEALRDAGFVDVERDTELSIFSAYRARKPELS